MIKLFSLLLVLLSTTSVYSAEIPYSPELEAKLAQLGNKQTARAVWSAANQGTSSSSAQSLGVVLPAKAIITGSYMYIATQLVDGGDNGARARLGFQCEDSANILTAVDLTDFAVGSILSGKQFGSGTTNSSSLTGMTDAIAAPCVISANVTHDNLDAGKVILFVDYVVGE